MDIVSKKKRSEMMSKIRGKNTKPELKIRKHLYSKGFRYRIHVSPLPGCPDIVLHKSKIAIQVRGCFWHGHHRCYLASYPKTNPVFWKKKIDENRERDLKNDRGLRKLGYRLLNIRECEIRKNKFKNKINKFL
jgi:DNA mismatch endonuclease (patch repair protein)|tara:strand:- start:431 stop:829 length:399 start_codon:yes stop_codon:yes gene_type:complete